MTARAPVIDAIVWDLDETLIREEPAVRDAFTRAGELAAARAGVPARDFGETARQCARLRWRASPWREYCARIGISSWEGLWGTFEPEGGVEVEAEGDEETTRALRAWLPEYRVAAWADALAAHAIEDAPLAEALARAFRDHIATAHVLYPDATAALDGLRGGPPMALLTNGDSGVQRHKVRNAGIGDRFRAIIVSGEVGAGKPDGRPFAAMARRLRIAPERLLMVGDSLERDVRGAIAAGWRAIWLDRSGVGGDAPDGAVRIEGLADLDYAELRAGRLAFTVSGPRRIP